MTHSTNKSCPACKKYLKAGDIFMLSFEKKKKIIEEKDKEFNDLLDEYGTKLAHLIQFLKTSKEHTIIFSQWDDMLRKVGKTLTENGIKNVFCRGNVYQRDKTIREFNSDSTIKIIMLSSESVASGTNLTKANQVILIDPIYGNYKFRNQTEKQAIGRAHRLGQKKEIQVIRYLVQDSVEELIHEMNIEEDNSNSDKSIHTDKKLSKKNI